MKPQGIFLSWIVVKNIKEAIEFYTKTVGLELKEFHEQFGWAELSGPDGSWLGLAQECSENGEIKPGSNAVVTISVGDIKAACNELKHQKVKLVGETMEIPGHVKLQTFLDNDGNTLQLVERLDLIKE